MSHPKPTAKPRAKRAQKPAEGLSGSFSGPPCPYKLSAKSQKVWDRVWEYGDAWLDPQNDLEAVARYCLYVQVHADLRETLDAEGLLSLGSTGQTVAHPALRELHSIEGHLSRLETALGLSPIGRARMGIARGEKEDTELGDFLGGFRV